LYILLQVRLNENSNQFKPIMKKILITLCIALLPALLMGHSPKKVTASFNEKTNKVRIEVTHPVKNAEKHFIELITISQGEKEIKTIPLQKQTDKEKELLEIELPGIKKGSEITIYAKCNQLGSRRTTLKL
jgi:desulfoferrodoxin (superoxide reductase-like protein)